MDTALMTASVVSIGVAVTACEDLALKRTLFLNNLFDWRYCLAFQPKLRPSRSGKLANGLFGPTAFQSAAVVRLLAIFFVVVAMVIDRRHAFLPLGVLLLAYFYLFYRIPYALDGSDQMTLFVLIGLFIMTLDTGTGAYLRLGSVAIAVHASISYLTSGIAKLGSPIWRSGKGLAGILTCAEYGNGLFGRLLQRNIALSCALSWVIILAHCFVGISILFGGTVVYLALTMSMTFHIFVALLMRLNGFVWAFGATFPAVLLLSDWNERLRFIDDLLGK